MSTIHEVEETTVNPPSVEPTSPARTGRRHRVDEQGHLIPPTEAERAEDLKLFLAGMAEMAALSDDPPGSDEEFWRAIDEGRPERPLFRDYYQP